MYSGKLVSLEWCFVDDILQTRYITRHGALRGTLRLGRENRVSQSESISHASLPFKVQRMIATCICIWSPFLIRPPTRSPTSKPFCVCDPLHFIFNLEFCLAPDACPVNPFKTAPGSRAGAAANGPNQAGENCSGGNISCLAFGDNNCRYRFHKCPVQRPGEFHRPTIIGFINRTSTFVTFSIIGLMVAQLPCLEKNVQPTRCCITGQG